MTIELNPDKEITEVSFDHKGSHLAITHKSQGYSANGKPDALLIKGETPDVTKQAQSLAELIKEGDAEVRIETDMVTFLRKWYGMWYDDAETLAMILGYNKEEVAEEEKEYKDYLAGKVDGITLLKASKSLPLLAKASEVKQLQDFIKANEALLKDSFSEGNSEVKDDIPASVEKSQTTPQKKPTNGDAKVTAEVLTLEKAKELTDRLEALEKANTEKETRIALFEKAESDRLEKAFNKKVETYSFVTDDERVEFAKTLMKLDNQDVITMLDKAQAAISAVTSVQGDATAVSTQPVEKSGVAALILAQFPETK